MALNVGAVYVDFEVKDEKAKETLKSIETSLQKTENTIKNFSETSSRNIQKASSSFENLKSEVDSLKNTIGNLNNAFKTIIVGLVANQFAQLGLNLEKTEKTFTTFLGSSEKAKSLLQELNKFANFTPFDNDEIIQASKSLLSFGVNVKDIMSNLKILGDISAGTGQRLTELSSIFGQVFVAGKLQTGEMNQLLERGIPILDALAKKLNVTKEEVKQMVSESKVSFDDFRDALQQMTLEGGLFANAMSTQSETVSGQISTLAGTFSDLTAKVSYLVIQGLRPFLDILIPIVSTLNDMATSLKDWYDNLSEGDKRLVQITIAIAGFTTAILVLLPVINTMLIPAIVRFATTVVPTLIASFTKLNAALGPVGWAIMALIATITILVIKFNDWKNVIEPLAGIIKDIVNAIKQTSAFQSLANVIKSFFDSFDVKSTDKIDKTISNLSALTIVVRSLVAVFSSLIIVIISAYQTIFNFSQVVVDSFIFLANVVLAVKDKIKDSNVNLTEELKKIWDEYKNKVAENANDIAVIFERNSQAVIDTFKKITEEPLKKEVEVKTDDESLKKVNQKINDELDKTKQKEINVKVNIQIQGGSDILTQTFANITNQIIELSNLFDSVIVQKNIDSLQQLANESQNVFYDIASTATNSLKGAIQSVGEFLKQFGQAISGILKTISTIIQASETLKNILQQKSNVITSWISYFYDKQIQALENFKNEQNNALEEELETYLDHLEEMRNAYKMHLREIELMSNEEYLRRRALLEQELQDKLRQDEEELQRRREFLEQNSQDSLEYHTNLEILEEDFRRLREEREREFQDALKQLQEEIANEKLNREIELNKNLLIEQGVYNEEQWNLMTEEKKRTAFLNYLKELEEQKQRETNLKKEENERNTNEQIKRLQREKLMIEYMNQLNAFNINKMMQILQLKIQMVTSIAQIWAGLLSGFAMIPFGLGIPIAIGLATALSAMVAGMFSQAIAIASSIPPPPPPAGLKSGGVLAGDMTTNSDTIPAMLMPGESVIDRDRTNRLFNAIDNNTMGSKTIQINNKIEIQGVIDEKLINYVSEKIHDKIKTAILV